MKWYEYVQFIVEIVCLISSIIGAVKANLAYKKIRNLENYNTYKSCEQNCDEIEKSLQEIVRYAKRKIKKGTSNPIEQYITSINNNIIYIKTNISNEDFENIKELLEDAQYKIKSVLQKSNYCILNTTIMEIDLQVIDNINKSMDEIRSIIKLKHQEISAIR